MSCVILFVCLSFYLLALALSVYFRSMSLTVPLVSFVPLLQLIKNKSTVCFIRNSLQTTQYNLIKLLHRFVMIVKETDIHQRSNEVEWGTLSFCFLIIWRLQGKPTSYDDTHLDFSSALRSNFSRCITL